LVLLGSVWMLNAGPVRLDSLKVGTKTYKSVTVIGANSTDLYFSHSTGIGNVKLRLLSPELQQRFGYDPQEAIETERAQAREDQAYYDLLQNELTTAAQRRIKEAKEAAMSHEHSLADPISERSLISRSAPKLEVDKWNGEKPFTAGKNILVFCWTTWSQPCQKIVPDLNALQKKLTESLVVVGVCAQPESDLARYTGPAMEFPTALDPNAKITAAIGAASVPYALLVNQKGIVLYQGHPGVLTTEKVEKLLGISEPATPK
jgi:cytochrome c biogenesis protein CcmG, thiol:disulfide interchange protein DsbE